MIEWKKHLHVPGEYSLKNDTIFLKMYMIGEASLVRWLLLKGENKSNQYYIVVPDKDGKEELWLSIPDMSFMNENHIKDIFPYVSSYLLVENEFRHHFVSVRYGSPNLLASYSKCTGDLMGIFNIDPRDNNLLFDQSGKYISQVPIGSTISSMLVFQK